MGSSASKRVAILGAGMIGEVHRRAAMLAGATVVGVMASSPDRSRQVAEEWRVEQAYADIDEVVASDAEIVHICTPNASHVPYAVALMEAGKHVLCEKPLGVGLADAQAGVRGGRPGPALVNTIPFAYRFHPMAREMRARVHDETSFGAVNLVHGQLSAGLAARPALDQLAGRPQGRRAVPGVRRHRLALVRPGRVGER